MRQLRTLTTRTTRLEQGQHTSSAIRKASVWPSREESFKAAQILQQRQPSRSLSNNRRASTLDTGMFRPVALPDQAYVQALPTRNKVVAAQNAARRRSGRYMDASEFQARTMQRSDRMDDVMSANRDHEVEMEAESEAQAQQEQRPEMKDEDRDYEAELELRSVRETVFGPPEDNDEDERMRAKADQELLRRVATTNRLEAPAPSISSKVISPYNSYRSHRTRWAEFRHGMIYGRSSF